jgi:hypothetical protein
VTAEPDAAAAASAAASAAAAAEKDDAPSEAPPTILFSVRLSLADGRVRYSPAGAEWEKLLVAFVAQPVDVLAAVGSLLDAPELKQYIEPQPIDCMLIASDCL